MNTILALGLVSAALALAWLSGVWAGFRAGKRKGHLEAHLEASQMISEMLRDGILSFSPEALKKVVNQ